MKLFSRRLILRPLGMADLADFHEHAALAEVSVPGGFPAPTSLARTRKRIRAAAADWKKPGVKRMSFSILLRSSGKWIGGISLRWPHVGVGEIGYGLHPRWWGKGYATEAAKKIVALAFDECGAHRVQATCWVKNPGSRRVLEKTGLRKEGTLRGYLKRDGVVRDEFMFGVTRADWFS